MFKVPLLSLSKQWLHAVDASHRKRVLTWSAVTSLSVAAAALIVNGNVKLTH